MAGYLLDRTHMRHWYDTTSYMSGEKITYKRASENLSHYMEKNKTPTSKHLSVKSFHKTENETENFRRNMNK